MPDDYEILKALVENSENGVKSDRALLELSQALINYTFALADRVKNLEEELLILQSVVMSKEKEKE